MADWRINDGILTGISMSMGIVQEYLAERSTETNHAVNVAIVDILMRLERLKRSVENAIAD